jgi:hypothetical protein
LSVDPLVSETGAPYGYAGDDPVNAMDPTGLCVPGFGAVCDAINVLSKGASVVAQGAADVANDTIQYSPVGAALDLASSATGMSLGLCAGGSYFGGPAFAGSLCYMATPSGQSGFTLSLGAGGGGPLGVNGLIGPVVSNAQNLNDLHGPFGYAEGTAGEGVFGAGAQGSIGQNSCGRTIWSSTFGWAPGARFPVPLPFTFGGGASYTWTFG